MEPEYSSTLLVLAPRPRWLDRQGFSTLFAGDLLLLISFTTNYGDDNLFHFSSLPATHKIGMGLHLAALAALAGDVELATRLRHRARNRAAVDEVGRRPWKENKRLAALESKMDALLFAE